MKKFIYNWLSATKCSQCLSGKIFLFSLLISCSSKQPADLILHNAIVYTVDSSFSTVQSFAIKNGRFIATGSNEEILSAYEAKEIIDAKGKAVYPGFIDSHCHFYGYGKGLQELDLVGTRSFDEVLSKVQAYGKTNTNEWIVGRGWDQNDWERKEFPTRYQLDKMFPNTPVLLVRIDGHAALANATALKLAGITADTKIKGGVIVSDMITEKNAGEIDWVTPEAASEIRHMKYPFPMPSGILIDNAVELVKSVIPKPSAAQISASLLRAQKDCFAAGLTTVSDAGLMKEIIDIIDTEQKNGNLKMRIYAMLTDSASNLDHYLNNGPLKTDRLNVRSFKFYADGALGSRGACLLQPYSDKPEERGFLLNTLDYFDRAAQVMVSEHFQMNTHCIGDSAVRIALDLALKYKAQSRRWRIEHFQVTTAEDIAKLKGTGIIPSVQPTHATSDMYWAKDRLSEKRISYAYAYNDLLKAAGMIALGTDFPVENISPMYTFYAAVARKDLKGFPQGGFQPENGLSRENTLKGMTIWGAYANFEEKEKGSIEKDKFADFVILENDIMKCEIDSVPTTKVIGTFVGGEKVY